MNSVITLFIQRMRIPLIVLISAYGIAILGFTVVPGYDELGNRWTMNFLEALYVVSYTGSTIGFGEIPREFSSAQRLWTILCIYMTVIAWLFAIGSLISLVQDSDFRNALRRRRLQGSVRAIEEPFYIICGYGDTGRLVVENLARQGRRSVVIDCESEVVQELGLTDHGYTVPAFCMDASIADNLVRAGLQRRWCSGVLALTDSDQTNLEICIASRLLNQQIAVIGRAGTDRAASNMASFETRFVIRPADAFAQRITLAIREPEKFLLLQRVHGIDEDQQGRIPENPEGLWLICGQDDWGRKLTRTLAAAGVRYRVIHPGDSSASGPDGKDAVVEPDQEAEQTITGYSSEAEVLRQAGVEEATGLIATHPDDAENLSTIMTARALNPGLFLAARENHLHNDLLYREAGTHLEGAVSGIAASAIRPILEAPLVVDFIELALNESSEWNKRCLEAINDATGKHYLQFWSSRVSTNRTPAISQAMKAGWSVDLAALLKDPARRDGRLPALPLLLRRNGQDHLLPAAGQTLATGDQVLFCGAGRARNSMMAAASDPDTLHYLLSGETRPGGWIWRRLKNSDAHPS